MRLLESVRKINFPWSCLEGDRFAEQLSKKVGDDKNCLNFCNLSKSINQFIVIEATIVKAFEFLNRKLLLS
jgi:hypothetical protein